MTYDRKRKKGGWFGHSKEHAIAARGRKVYPNRRKRVYNRPAAYPTAIIDKSGKGHRLKKPIIVAKINPYSGQHKIVLRSTTANRPQMDWFDYDNKIKMRDFIDRQGNYVDIFRDVADKGNGQTYKVHARVYARDDGELNNMLNKDLANPGLIDWKEAVVPQAASRYNQNKMELDAYRKKPEYGSGQDKTMILKTVQGLNGKTWNVHAPIPVNSDGWTFTTIRQKVFLDLLNIEDDSTRSGTDYSNDIHLALPSNDKQYLEKKGLDRTMRLAILNDRKVKFKPGKTMPSDEEYTAKLKAKSFEDRVAEMTKQETQKDILEETRVKTPNGYYQMLKPTVQQQGNQKVLITNEMNTPKGTVIETPLPKNQKTLKEFIPEAKAEKIEKQVDQQSKHFLPWLKRSPLPRKRDWSDIYGKPDKERSQSDDDKVIDIARAINKNYVKKKK